jgi:cytochrome subunit of sulfide dehydrogenase
MNVIRSATLAIMLLAPTFCLAADEPPGAASCSGCHAVRSGVQSPVPPLNGRNAAETVGAMAEFRSGARASTVMDRIAKGFSPEEAQAIAAWLQTQAQPK